MRGRQQPSNSRWVLISVRNRWAPSLAISLSGSFSFDIRTSVVKLVVFSFMQLLRGLTDDLAQLYHHRLDCTSIEAIHELLSFIG